MSHRVSANMMRVMHLSRVGELDALIKNKE